MKRTLMLALGALLALSPVALAGPYDQDKNERPRRISISDSGYLGVEIEEVTRDVAGRLRLREERGALITGVTGDTAAAKAGLQKDDVIVRWNGEAVESARELSRHIRETPAGRSVKLGVLRNGSEMEVAVTLGSRGDHISYIGVGPVARIAPVAPAAPIAPRAPRARIAVPAMPARVYVRERYQLGISLQSMSPQLAEYFGLQNRNGALVTVVHPDSAAAKAGIKAGDVILSVGGTTVENPWRVSEALRDKGEGAVEVKLMRDRQERTVTVQLEKGKTSFVWSDGEGADVVMSEALSEPLEIGPINIEPLRMAPLDVPRIYVAPSAPLDVPEIRIAPMAMPRVTIPKVKMPKIVIPPMRIVVPDMIFRTEV